MDRWVNYSIDLCDCPMSSNKGVSLSPNFVFESESVCRQPDIIKSNNKSMARYPLESHNILADTSNPLKTVKLHQPFNS